MKWWSIIVSPRPHLVTMQALESCSFAAVARLNSTNTYATNLFTPFSEELWMFVYNCNWKILICMYRVEPSGELGENVALWGESLFVVVAMAVADADMGCWCWCDLGSHMYLGRGNQCECKYVFPPPPLPPASVRCEAEVLLLLCCMARLSGDGIYFTKY